MDDAMHTFYVAATGLMLVVTAILQSWYQDYRQRKMSERLVRNQQQSDEKRTVRMDHIAEAVKEVKEVVDGVAHLVLITTDMDGVILDTTDSAKSLTGYSPAELVGKNVDMLLPQRYQQRHRSALAASKVSGNIRPRDIAIIGHLKCKLGAEIPIIVCLVQSGNNRVTAQLIRCSEALLTDDPVKDLPR